jgi:thiamine-monophosphate kinase
VELALYAGDDYQLCVTLPEASLNALPAGVREQLTVIGRVCPGHGLAFEGQGVPAPAQQQRGYDHFGSQ